MKAATKRCPRCEAVKSVSDFGKHKSAPGGIRSSCLECNRKATRKYRYGDENYVTPDHVRVERQRAAFMRNNPAKPTSYKKHYGRHEHRVVAEQMLGRPLQPKEIVHHKDGNRHNNSPDNLQVMSQSDHMKLHWDALFEGRRLKHGY